MHPPDEEPGIAALAMLAIEDAKRWGRAEVAYYRALAGERGTDAGVGLALGLAALAIAQAALAAMLVGLVLSLAPIVGALGATAIVVLIALLVVALLGWLAIGRFRRAGRPTGKGAL